MNAIPEEHISRSKGCVENRGISGECLVYNRKFCKLKCQNAKKYHILLRRTEFHLIKLQKNGQLFGKQTFDVILL